MAVEIPSLVAALSITIWYAGYFAIKSVASGGFGTFRLNLTAPFRAEDIWSIWSSRGFLAGDDEGFCYLGAGIMLLCVTTAALIIKHRKDTRIAWRTHASLIFVCVLFYLFALSNRIALGGNHEILEYPLPAFLAPFTSTFRASGQFVWPVFYTGIVFLLFRFIQFSPRKWTVPLLCVFLLFQATDLIKASKYFRNRWSQPWHSSLTSDFWEDVSKQYKRIALVISLDGGDAYAPIALMASIQRERFETSSARRV